MTVWTMLRAWGAPIVSVEEDGDRFLGLTPDAIPSPTLKAATERVAAVANWYPEITSLVVGLVLDGDADRLRAWNRAMLERVGYETAEVSDPTARMTSARAYADRVMDALGGLASLIETEEGEP